MNEEPKQGALANSSGNTLEKTIIATLVSNGFHVVMYRDYLKKPGTYSDELILRNVPFTSIYGHQGNTEFLIKSKKYNLKFGLNVSGSKVREVLMRNFPTFT